MKNVTKNKKIIIKILFIVIAVYVTLIFINQQKTINSYKTAQKYYTEEIENKMAYHESLNEIKNNVNSKEYIEKMAREKLDMYLPNERVYIDKTK